jgi:hypothetical protein
MMSWGEVAQVSTELVYKPKMMSLAVIRKKRLEQHQPRPSLVENQRPKSHRPRRELLKSLQLQQMTEMINPRHENVKATNEGVNDPHQPPLRDLDPWAPTVDPPTMHGVLVSEVYVIIETIVPVHRLICLLGSRRVL